MLIACVADGAGSARYSDQASRAAVESFVAVSANLLQSGYPPDKVVTEPFREARRMVSDIAGDNVEEFATTLLGLVATRDMVSAGQVGDGAIIIDGEVALEPHSGARSAHPHPHGSPGTTPAPSSVLLERYKLPVQSADNASNHRVNVNQYQTSPDLGALALYSVTETIGAQDGLPDSHRPRRRQSDLVSHRSVLGADQQP